MAEEMVQKKNGQLIFNPIFTRQSEFQEEVSSPTPCLIALYCYKPQSDLINSILVQSFRRRAPQISIVNNLLE